LAMAIGLLAAPSPAPARDAAWPLYRNEKFGFEFRYPPALVATVLAKARNARA